MKAAGDAREDQRDIDGAEVARDVGVFGGSGVLSQRAGDLPAIVDQRADEAEEAPGNISEGPRGAATERARH
jgi:hypothetical protein